MVFCRISYNKNPSQRRVVTTTETKENTTLYNDILSQFSKNGK